MNEVKEGFMKDAQGRMVPLEMVRPIDQERDSLVHRLEERCAQVRTVCQQFREWADAEIEAYLQLSQEKYDIAHGGQHGNLTLTSYDGELRVLRAVQRSITFGDEIHAAKALIDECLKEWCDGARAELRVMVDDAFKVDKSGDLAADRILGLRRLAIVDPRWQKAMEAIAASIQVQSSKRYLRFYRRAPNGEYILQPAGV